MKSTAEYEQVLKTLFRILKDKFGISIEGNDLMGRRIKDIFPKGSALDWTWFLLEVSRVFGITLSNEMIECYLNLNLDEVARAVLTSRQ